MAVFKTYSFSKEGAEKIKHFNFGNNWPVVYIIENNKELYVGQSLNAYKRTRDHLKNPDRQGLEKIHIITDEEYNASATLDAEAWLIEYLAADGKYLLQNSNGGLQHHNYYDKEKYSGKFEQLWRDLQLSNIAEKDLVQIRNSDLFKYSPYKTLTNEQLEIAEDILEELKRDGNRYFLIHGGPGTGKTILATFLIKQLTEQKVKNVALVVAMGSLRKTLKRVFQSIKGLNPSMVIGPNEVTKKEYDVLIVDEAHRLRQRRNLTNYRSFDETNRLLGMNGDATELDWIKVSAKRIILFYDEKQSVRPTDILPTHVKSLESKEYSLKAQVRIKGGDNYIKAIDNILEGLPVDGLQIQQYDFRILDSVGQLVELIKQKDAEHKLSRVIAGYAWPWLSKKDKNIPDIVIGETKLFWNSVLHDWVNSKNAVNEVGCIHTIQGYDLNYAGVIIGPEIDYDETKKAIIVDKDKYYDANGKRAVWDDAELKRYIINIYKTLLTRGIYGTYVYIHNEKLREYFRRFLLK